MVIFSCATLALVIVLDKNIKPFSFSYSFSNLSQFLLVLDLVLVNYSAVF